MSFSEIFSHLIGSDMSLYLSLYLYINVHSDCQINIIGLIINIRYTTRPYVGGKQWNQREHLLRVDAEYVLRCKNLIEIKIRVESIYHV